MQHVNHHGALFNTFYCSGPTQVLDSDSGGFFRFSTEGKPKQLHRKTPYFVDERAEQQLHHVSVSEHVRRSKLWFCFSSMWLKLDRFLEQIQISLTLWPVWMQNWIPEDRLDQKTSLLWSCSLSLRCSTPAWLSDLQQSSAPSVKYVFNIFTSETIKYLTEINTKYYSTEVLGGLLQIWKLEQMFHLL